MHTSARILHVTALTIALGCGDDTGETAEETGSTGSTSGTTVEPTTSPVDTGQTVTTQPDPTVATSLDSSGSTTTTAEPADIEVSIEGQTVASGDLFVMASPADVGAIGETVTLVIENVGGADLSIAGVSAAAGATAHFALDDGELDGSLTPGASTSVTVTFTPTNGGRKQVEILIDSDDPDESEYTVVIEATTTPNTWRDVAPANLPPARFNAAMAGDYAGRVLLFGGRTAGGMRVSDTWLLDVEAGDWIDLAPPDAPSARDASALAWVGGDTFVLFGGNETSGPGGSVTPLSDTWIFDVAAGTWTELTPPTTPAARFQHAMVTLDDGLALLQGGRSEFMMEMADTWQFDVAAQDWVDVAPTMDPGTRSAFGLASTGDGTAVVMVGGSLDSTTFVDETWVYDAGSNAWMPGAAAGLGAQLNNATVWLDGLTFVSYSGKLDCCSDPAPGTWAYDADADAWTDLAPTLEPAARFSHRMVSVGGNKAIMFGGLLVNADFGSASAATWEYVGPQP